MKRTLSIALLTLALALAATACDPTSTDTSGWHELERPLQLVTCDDKPVRLYADADYGAPTQIFLWPREGIWAFASDGEWYKLVGADRYLFADRRQVCLVSERILAG